MPAHMSNKDRIAKMAAEKAAEKKEKAEKKTTTKKKATKKKASKSATTKSAGRMKVVWVVCDQAGGPVKTFAFTEEKTARSEAERLTQDKGKTHFVKRDKVPMES